MDRVLLALGTENSNERANDVRSSALTEQIALRSVRSRGINRHHAGTRTLICETRRTVSGVVLVSALLLAGVGFAFGRPSDPAEPVLRLRAGIIEAAALQWPPPLAPITQLVDSTFDLERIARDVLGRQTETYSVAQRDRLARALGQRMVREMLRRKPDPADGFRVLAERQLPGGEWLIMTRVEPHGEDPIMLSWRVIPDRDGFRIVDILRDGVSAAIIQREDLASALRTRPLDAVISDLEQRGAAHGP